MFLRGNLIVIDGADAAGKATQTKLLEEALRAEGNEVFLFDFPQDDRRTGNIFGRLVREALNGRHGNFRAVSPYIASWLFTLDRLIAKEEIVRMLECGVVLCNRYVPSNIAYQAAKLSGESQKDFISFLEHAEYNALEIPRPTCVVYLSVPEEVSQRLLRERGVQLDQHEVDVEYQRRVNVVYHNLARSNSSWCVVECALQGELLSRDEIHKKIMEVVKEVVLSHKR